MLPAISSAANSVTAYAMLSHSHVEVGRALLADRHWRWPAGVFATYPDGRLLEIRTPSAATSEALPYLPDARTTGALVGLLDEACLPAGVLWTMGRRPAGKGQIYWCRLEAGPHERAWAGDCLGEAVARALLARWERM